MGNKQLVFMYVIADRKKKDELIGALSKSGAALINFSFGIGYHESRTMFDYLGFSDKRGKVVIRCLISREKSTGLIDTLNEEYGFKLRGSGIAFTIPIEKLVY